MPARITDYYASPRVLRGARYTKRGMNTPILVYIMNSNCLSDDYCSLLLSFLSLDFDWDNVAEKQDILKCVANGSKVVAEYLKEAAEKYS